MVIATFNLSKMVSDWSITARIASEIETDRNMENKERKSAFELLPKQLRC